MGRGRDANRGSIFTISLSRYTKCPGGHGVFNGWPVSQNKINKLLRTLIQYKNKWPKFIEWAWEQNPITQTHKCQKEIKKDTKK